MNRAKVQLTKPEPGLENALRAHKLETWLPVILTAVAVTAVLASSIARMVLQ
jgi:hypothetical protein